ncbi:MAG: hypothetical protein HY695_07195 [Deltaproteobacteria bacterium]|nr:hypothetical protein [Deltaproteobacteria bacterium]
MDEPTEVSAKQLEGEYRSVGMFVENAKTYIQLATGALLLSVTFSQGVTGQTGLPVKDLSLWVAWLSWLVAILAGATYQYCAAKYLEALELQNRSLFYGRAEPFFVLRHWVRNPYQLYGVLMIFFYGGIIWFTCAAAYQLLR